MQVREYEVMYQVEDEHWWYVGMRDIIFSTLAVLRGVQDAPSWRILDAGCGTGAIAQRLGRFGEVVAIDLSSFALQLGKRRDLAGTVSQASVTALPLLGGTFDLVVSIDVLCSVPDHERALAEFHRVLKPGGLLLMNLPALDWLKGQHDLAVDILRRYTPTGLEPQLIQHGFGIEKMTFANSLLFPFAACYRVASRWLPANRNAPRSDLFVLPRPVNGVLRWVMGLESHIIRRASLPIGMSLFVVARKLVKEGNCCHP